jgi:hypothetical protein
VHLVAREPSRLDWPSSAAAGPATRASLYWTQAAHASLPAPLGARAGHRARTRRPRPRRPSIASGLTPSDRWFNIETGLVAADGGASMVGAIAGRAGRPRATGRRAEIVGTRRGGRRADGRFRVARCGRVATPCARGWIKCGHLSRWRQEPRHDLGVPALPVRVRVDGATPETAMRVTVEDVRPRQ